MNCTVCDKPLSERNVTGYCRKHYAAHNNAERTRQQAIRQWADPEWREKHTDCMRILAGKRVAWCPVEYRGDYKRLKRVKHYSAAEARLLIEQQIAQDTARYLRTGKLQQSVRL
jgi:hypothetical protein